MQTEDVEGNVLEWGTNLFKEGYCCFENSTYWQKWEQGLENNLWTGEFRIHGFPPPRDLLWMLGSGLFSSGILNQVREWVDFLKFNFFFPFYIVPETSAVGVFHWCCGLGNLTWLFCMCSDTEPRGQRGTAPVMCQNSTAQKNVLPHRWQEKIPGDWYGSQTTRKQPVTQKTMF